MTVQVQEASHPHSVNRVWWKRLFEKRFSNPSLFDILHCRQGFSALPLWAKLMHGVFLINLIIAIISLILSAEPSIAKLDTAQVTLFSIDLACCFVFAFEYGLAFYSAPTYRHLFTIMYFIDFMSFFPRFVVFFAVLESQPKDAFSYGYMAKNGFETVNMTSYRIIRIFRVLRLLRYIRMSLRLRLMIKALKNYSGILMIAIVLPLMVLIYSMLIVFAEQTEMDFKNGQWVYDDGTPSPYQSIPSAFWITILILTGEGLSSDPPRSVLAKLVSALAMVSSIFLVAFPVTMVTIQIQQAVRYFGLKQRKKYSQDNLLNSTWISPSPSQEDLKEENEHMRRAYEMIFPKDPSSPPVSPRESCIVKIPCQSDLESKLGNQVYYNQSHCAPIDPCESVLRQRKPRLVIDKWWLTSESHRHDAADQNDAGKTTKQFWSPQSTRPSMDIAEKDVLVLEIDFDNEHDLEQFIFKIALQP